MGWKEHCHCQSSVVAARVGGAPQKPNQNNGQWQQNNNDHQKKETIDSVLPTFHIFQKRMTDISLPRPEKKFSNLPSDWRLEQPPKGDWRFLGHPSHDARGHLKKHSQFSPWVLRLSHTHFIKKKTPSIVSVFFLVE